jgi:hypothetical protein
MKKMIVCGDSFMTAVPNFSDLTGKHFCQILATKLNYDIEFFAREGMSNGGIALQIKSAIKRNPNLILVGTSHFDRIEFPIGDTPENVDFDVTHIQYCHYNSISTYYDWHKNPLLVSSNLHEFITNDKKTFKTFGKRTLNNIENSSEKQEALFKYFTWLYYPSWKKQLDKWTMYAILHELHESNIPYIICFDLLNVIDNISWIPIAKKAIKNNIADLVNIDNAWGRNPIQGPEIAHTSIHCQEQIAELLLNNLPEYV